MREPFETTSVQESDTQQATLSRPVQRKWPQRPQSSLLRETNTPALTKSRAEIYRLTSHWHASKLRIIGASKTSELEILEQIYVVTDRARVFSVVSRYTFLIPLLLEAGSQIRRYFGNSQISLDVISDPEEPVEPQLVASVTTNLSPEKAFAQLEKFDEDWWLEALDRTKGKFSVNLQFK